MYDEKIVSQVQRWPALYNTNHTLYKNNSHRRRIWREVAMALNLSTQFCQTRWKRLRDKFMRYYKPTTRNGTAIYQKEFPLLKKMTFLLPFVGDGNDEQRNTAPNSNPLSETDECDESKKLLKDVKCSRSESGSPPVEEPFSMEITVEQPELLPPDSPFAPSSIEGIPAMHERMSTYDNSDFEKIARALNCPTRSYDGLDHFGLSIANDLRSMPASEQRRVKLEIAIILANAKYKDENK